MMSSDFPFIATLRRRGRGFEVQISMRFGYFVVSDECTKPLEWIDSIALYAPVTPP